MKRVTALLVLLGAVGASSNSQAQLNLLVNGDFESPSTNVYYDGFDPSVADDVPGWLMFVGAADGSYVLVSPDASGTTDLDSGNGPAGGGIQTAAVNRPSVTALLTYRASVTYDNYFGPADAAYFIDWFDVGGSLIDSSGGLLGDPNGPLGYDPYGQAFNVDGEAPLTAVSAGVRFQSGNGAYAGLAADNFSLSVVPEPGSLALAGAGVLAFLAVCRRMKRLTT